MKTPEQWLEALERQAALIDSLDLRINGRAKAGEPVALSLEVLRDEETLYRRLLGQAPVEVVFTHARDAASRRRG